MASVIGGPRLRDVARTGGAGNGRPPGRPGDGNNAWICRDARTKGMNARGRRSHCRPPGGTREHGPVAAPVNCRYTCYLRPPARLAPVRRDVLPSLVNRADPSRGAD
jgi:hypothetical protein